MKIECKTTFRDGTDTFHEGDIRTVDDARAYGFIALGWAAEVGQAAAPLTVGSTNLDIHNAALGLGDTNG